MPSAFDPQGHLGKRQRVKTAPTPGYSGTPLAKKLGIAAGHGVLTRDAPPDYAALLAPLPRDVRWLSRPGADVDIAHVFATRRNELEKQLSALRKALRAEVPVWVSWPKKSAKIATDISEDTIRQIGIPLGFVDIKVCAVSAVWSGLKLVVRKQLR